LTRYPLLLSALLVLSGSTGSALAASDSRAEREKAKLESLRDQRNALEQQLKRNESARSQAADQLRAAETAISASGRKLRVLGEERATAQNALARHERELKQLETQTAARQTQLARLLRYQFRPREADALAVLLAGGDPNAAARDRHFLALLARAKADLIASLRRDAGETRRLADIVKTHGAQLAELSKREESERANLRQRQQERQVALTQISARIQSQRREIDTLKQNEQRLGNLIATLAKRSAKSSKASKPSVAPRTAPATTATSSDPISAGGAFARLRGKLTRPLKGTLLSRFGAPREDGQSTWKGLFIGASEGADVRAVAPGVVVFADWLRGYGNLLIIDHDDDFLSVYGNNQSLLADVGKKVGAGDTVASVGAAGIGRPDSGLYFELRHRGRAFDPQKWLGTP